MKKQDLVKIIKSALKEIKLTEAKVQTTFSQVGGKSKCVCNFPNGTSMSMMSTNLTPNQCQQACDLKWQSMGGGTGKETPDTRDSRYDMDDIDVAGGIPHFTYPERHSGYLQEGREHLSREGGMCRCNGKRYSTSFCGLSCDCCDSDGWWSGMSVVSYDFEDKGDMAMGDMSRSDMDMGMDIDKDMMDMDNKFSMRENNKLTNNKMDLKEHKETLARFKKLAGIIKEEEDKKDEGHGYSMEELKAMMEETDNEGKMMNESLFAAIGGLVGVLGAAGVTSAIEMALEDPAIAEKYPKLAKVFEFLAKVGGAVGKGIK